MLPNVLAQTRKRWQVSAHTCIHTHARTTTRACMITHAHTHMCTHLQGHRCLPLGRAGLLPRIFSAACLLLQLREAALRTCMQQRPEALAVTRTQLQWMALEIPIRTQLHRMALEILTHSAAAPDGPGNSHTQRSCTGWPWGFSHTAQLHRMALEILTHGAAAPDGPGNSHTQRRQACHLQAMQVRRQARHLQAMHAICRPPAGHLQAMQVRRQAPWFMRHTRHVQPA